MRERTALSNPTQTAMKGLRAIAKRSLCRSAMRRDIFEIDSAAFCNLTIGSQRLPGSAVNDTRLHHSFGNSRPVPALYEANPGCRAMDRSFAHMFRAKKPKTQPASTRKGNQCQDMMANAT